MGTVLCCTHMKNFDIDLDELLVELEEEMTKPTARQVLTVPECDCSRELDSFLDELTTALAAVPPALTLRFVGVHNMNPDPALAVYDLLSRKPPGTKLITEAVSPLICGSVLVWLAGDCRRIRSTAWIYLRHPDARRHRFPPWEMGEEWQADREAEPDLPLRDYRTVLRLIGGYFPVKDFVGKQVAAACLDEFCLLEENVSPEPAALTAKPSRQHKRASGKPNPKRFWFIERGAQGGYTLKGGWPIKLLKKDPTLRQTDLGHNFATKEELLKHLDTLNFCQENNAVIVDGEEIVRR